MGATQTWFRNPSDYIRELVECGVGNVAWDRGMLVKKKIDPSKHAQLYFGQAIPYRLLLVGDQGTAELDAEHTIENPKAVYPTWTYGENQALLEEIVAYPVGNEARFCEDKSIAVDERPVLGQEHRVVITHTPPGNSGPGRKFLRYLKELQEEYPKCIIHVHGLYGYKSAFGLGFGAADVEPRVTAQKGKVFTPAGKEIPFEHLTANPKWATVLGFKPVDLAVPRNRCMYNIKSALWAGQHYHELYNFPTASQVDPDTETPDAEYSAPVKRGTTPFTGHSLRSREGDKFACDTCSLQNECNYFRSGAVCSVPGAEPVELAKYFNTRDSGMILDGLGVLMAAQTRRLEKGMREEEEFGELSGDVTKIMNSLFDQGVKLAKLVDPALRSPKVQVNVAAQGSASVVNGNPRQFIAAAIRELELQGVKREDITPQMIEGVMSGMSSQSQRRQAIEGAVIERNA